MKRDVATDEEHATKGQIHDPDAVANYLKQNPEFFEEHADIRRDLIPHPHGGRAIPITERQILTLREKNSSSRTSCAS